MFPSFANAQLDLTPFLLSSFRGGYTNVNDAYKPGEQIRNLYAMLNRQTSILNFSKITHLAAILQDGGGIAVFLWQMILTKELARRIEKFPAEAESASGFGAQVLGSLLMMDNWFRNVELRLSDDPAYRGPRSADPFDMVGRELSFLSIVHERQTEALVKFGEMMSWPHITAVRNYARDVYAGLHADLEVSSHLWEWLYGLMLPGQWTAFKLMAALVLCTPSLSKSLGVAYYYDCGVSLPEKSYWRNRTVLGRVLGCLPGVKTVCGWIGPCPAVEVVGAGAKKAKYIRVKARRVAPPKPIVQLPANQQEEQELFMTRNPDEGFEWSTNKGQWKDVREWVDDITTGTNWVLPPAPEQKTYTCKLVKVVVKALPLDPAIERIKFQKSAEDLENETEFRASIEFVIDNGEPVSYTLFANPTFVTLPPCKRGTGPAGWGHQVHVRTLEKYTKHVYDVKQLKDVSGTGIGEDEVLVINATVPGAEVVARAWCAAKGRDAVIRRNPGACFACAHQMATRRHLGVGVLIWVS